jgi:hypothetical protein
LINTGIAPFIARQPERLSRHIDILKFEHAFLDHDSKIACDDLVVLEGFRELARRMAERDVEVLGRVTDPCAQRILGACAGSKLISERDHALIVESFTHLE